MTKNLFYSISFCFRQISHRSKSPCNRCNEISLIHFNQKKIWDGWEANHCRISARQTFEQQFCETVDVHCTNEFVCVHRIFIAEQDRQKTRKNVPKQNFNMIWRNDYENKTRAVCACLKFKKNTSCCKRRVHKVPAWSPIKKTTKSNFAVKCFLHNFLKTSFFLQFVLPSRRIESYINEVLNYDTN